jgi:hypothetical protein
VRSGISPQAGVSGNDWPEATPADASGSTSAARKNLRRPVWFRMGFMARPYLTF